jgi:hypothetical protein
VAVVALLAFLVDFVTPTTPTPIAVGRGKSVAQPLLAIVGIVIAARQLVLVVNSFALLDQIVSRSDSDLLERICIRRC